MSKLLYSVTMSLDGFIAGPDGDMSWLTAYLGTNPTIDGLIDDVGSLFVGNRTYGGNDPYEGVDGSEGEAFGGGWAGPQFVLTHHPPQDPVRGVAFVTDFDDGIARAKAAAGGKYVNVLGATIARQCLQAGELDEVLVCIAPVMLGDGVRLFDFPGGSQVKLERISVTEAELATNLWFRVLA